MLCHMLGEVVAIGIFRQGTQGLCRGITKDAYIGDFVHEVMGDIAVMAVIGNEIIPAVVGYQIVGADGIFVVGSPS